MKLKYWEVVGDPNTTFDGVEEEHDYIDYSFIKGRDKIYMIKSFNDLLILSLIILFFLPLSNWFLFIWFMVVSYHYSAILLELEHIHQHMNDYYYYHYVELEARDPSISPYLIEFYYVIGEIDCKLYPKGEYFIDYAVNTNVKLKSDKKYLNLSNFERNIVSNINISLEDHSYNLEEIDTKKYEIYIPERNMFNLTTKLISDIPKRKFDIEDHLPKYNMDYDIKMVNTLWLSNKTLNNNYIFCNYILAMRYKSSWSSTRRNITDEIKIK